MNIPNKSNLPIGTLLFSSNRDKSLNQTPGIFNHICGIVDIDQNIVEAQEKYGVIKTSWIDYVARDYDWNNWGVLYPIDKSVGIQAATKALSYVGTKYGLLSSIRLFSRRMNCVLVWAKAYNIDAKIVDDFIKYNTLFTDKLDKSK